MVYLFNKNGMTTVGFSRVDKRDMHKLLKEILFYSGKVQHSLIVPVEFNGRDLLIYATKENRLGYYDYAERKQYIESEDGNINTRNVPVMELMAVVSHARAKNKLARSLGILGESRFREIG